MPAAGVRSALFLHGAGAWGGQWLIWQRVFAAAGWATSAPDLAPAPAGLAATSLDDDVSQARDAMEALPEDPVVIGASLGGLLAAALGARSDGGTRRPVALVLVNPVPSAPFSMEVPGLAPEDGASVVPWRSASRFDSTCRALPGAPFDDRHLAFRHWRDESAHVLREAQVGLALDPPACPVLLIASEGDREVSPALSERYAHALGASVLRVPGTHLDPVMGTSAAAAAKLALGWCGAQLSSA